MFCFFAGRSPRERPDVGPGDGAQEGPGGQPGAPRRGGGLGAGAAQQQGQAAEVSWQLPQTGLQLAAEEQEGQEGLFQKAQPGPTVPGHPSAPAKPQSR